MTSPPVSRSAARRSGSGFGSKARWSRAIPRRRRAPAGRCGARRVAACRVERPQGAGQEQISVGCRRRPSPAAEVSSRQPEFVEDRHGVAREKAARRKRGLKPHQGGAMVPLHLHVHEARPGGEGHVALGYPAGLNEGVCAVEGRVPGVADLPHGREHAKPPVRIARDRRGNEGGAGHAQLGRDTASTHRLRDRRPARRRLGCPRRADP